MNTRLTIALCFMTLLSNATFADGGACATKPEFDPMQTYCYLYQEQKTCDAWWETCVWIPSETVSCKAKTSGMESYCASIDTSSTCNAHRDCVWQ